MLAKSSNACLHIGPSSQELSLSRVCKLSLSLCRYYSLRQSKGVVETPPSGVFSIVWHFSQGFCNSNYFFVGKKKPSEGTKVGTVTRDVSK